MVWNVVLTRSTHLPFFNFNFKIQDYLRQDHDRIVVVVVVVVAVAVSWLTYLPMMAMEGAFSTLGF